mmetsp:Transcript_3734/g.17125  ORF Transcript_3734/g.17125 Transcript_3734/m.17125 type:complete len:239 (+) Transcript_3734:2418-3134(+)
MGREGRLASRRGTPRPLRVGRGARREAGGGGSRVGRVGSGVAGGGGGDAPVAARRMERAEDRGGSHGDANRRKLGRRRVGRRAARGAHVCRPRRGARVVGIRCRGAAGGAGRLGRGRGVRAGERADGMGRRYPRVLTRRSHDVEGTRQGGGSGGGGEAEGDQGVDRRRRARRCSRSSGRRRGRRVHRVGTGRSRAPHVALGTSRVARLGRGGRRIRRWWRIRTIGRVRICLHVVNYTE